MITVALIGPDGAGKTTVSRQLQQSLPLPVVCLYMGVNHEASAHLLPTTRLVRAIKRACGGPPDAAGPRDPQQADLPARGALRRALRGAKSLAGLANRVAEEWYRQLLAWYHCRRGRIVLFDRHYFSDYYAYDVAPGDQRRSLARRIHGYLLRRFYPHPDLVILLDAPGEVLFARKGEGTAELLERRRRDYLQLKDVVPRFAVVDAAQPADGVVRDVAGHILDLYRSRSGIVSLEKAL